jgi:hypothetical protein
LPQDLLAHLDDIYSAPLSKRHAPSPTLLPRTFDHDVDQDKDQGELEAALIYGHCPGSDQTNESSKAGDFYSTPSTLYYHRQLLARSLEKRRIYLLTITDFHGMTSEQECVQSPRNA